MNFKRALRTSLLMSILLIANNTYAFIDGIRLGYGHGRPANLNGLRLAVQKHWPVWFESSLINLSGLWELNFAYWYTDGDINKQHRRLYNLAIAAVLRLLLHKRFFYPIQPYIEASVGPAILSSRFLAHRDLGSKFAFQNLLGGGILFGADQQYDFSIDYLHYSNAGISSPNDGIDVRILVSLGWRFSDSGAS